MQRQCFYMQRQCFYVQKQCFCSQRLWCMESPRNSAFLHKNTKKTLIPNCTKKKFFSCLNLTKVT